MTWDPEESEREGQTLADRYAGNRYAARGQHLVEELALAVLDKLKGLLPSMAESFAQSFAEGVEGLLAQQDEQLTSRQLLPLVLPELLPEEIDLRYKKQKRRAMTGLEAAEERERGQASFGLPNSLEIMVSF
jgi:hypothetical protein